MNKTTEKIVTAFLARKTVKFGNDSTDGVNLFLHNNLIAQHLMDGGIIGTLAGWPTRTTRERLNGVCQLTGSDKSFYQKGGLQFFGSEEIGPNKVVDIVEPILPDCLKGGL